MKNGLWCCWLVWVVVVYLMMVKVEISLCLSLCSRLCRHGPPFAFCFDPTMFLPMPLCPIPMFPHRPPMPLLYSIPCFSCALSYAPPMPLLCPFTLCYVSFCAPISLPITPYVPHKPPPMFLPIASFVLSSGFPMASMLPPVHPRFIPIPCLYFPSYALLMPPYFPPYARYTIFLCPTAQSLCPIMCCFAPLCPFLYPMLPYALPYVPPMSIHCPLCPNPLP